MRSVGISPREKLFQRVMVHLQMALEDGLAHALCLEEPRLILCHRGSLDPLAYWLNRGWPEEEFFAYTQTNRQEHYARYAAVIHLVTAADGAVAHYKRYPEAHRPETPQQAVEIDRLLERVWSEHPRYYQIGNEGCDWLTKSLQAQRILEGLCDET